MMEFMLTMAVIALVFVAATIVVALIAGGLVKLRDTALKRNTEKVAPEYDQTMKKLEKGETPSLEDTKHLTSHDENTD